MVALMGDPERFLHKENTDRSFDTVANRDKSVPTASEGATLAPKSFAKALQALHDSNCHPQQETTKMVLAYGPFDMPSNSSIQQTIQKVVTSRMIA